MRKPPLLDKLVDESVRDTLCEINGRWYIAKPIQLSDFTALIERFYHAWLIICGRAFAVQYAEDQIVAVKEEDFKLP